MSCTAVVLRGLVCCALLLASLGCIYLGPGVPVRVSTQTKDISGAKRDLDLSFLRAGSTTRDEVVKNLAPIDTGTKESHFFWGRWESSNWASAPLLAPYAGSREWGPQNILIAFDQTNLVRSWKIVKDKELFRELDRLEPTSRAPLDLSSPLRLNVKLRYWESDPTADLTLSAQSFEYAARHGFTTARRNVKRLTLTSEVLPSTDPFDRTAHSQPDPSHIWIMLHFAKRTAKGKSLTIGVDPPTLLLLRRYVEQMKTGPGAVDS